MNRVPEADVKTEIISFRANKELAKELAKYCERVGERRSKVVCEIIADYLTVS